MTLPDYVTATQIKNSMPDATWGTEYDSLLADIATRASRAIDEYCRRPPGYFAVSVDSTRYYDGSGCEHQWIDDVAAITSVAVDESGVGTYTTWAASDYRKWPYNAADQGKPYCRLDVDVLNGSKAAWYAFPQAVRVTGKFGWAQTAPVAIVQATIIQALQFFKKGQSGYISSGATTYASMIMGSSEIDPELAQLLRSFRRGPQ